MKKIVFSILAALAMVVSGYAQTTADSVFVVKDGKVVGAYEIGKDVDYLTFHRPANSLANYMQHGSATIELKSAFVMTQSGYTYVIASPIEGLDSYEAITESGSDYLFIAVPETEVGQDVKLSTEEDYAQAYWMTPDYEYSAGSSNYDYEDDGYTDGTIRVELTDTQVSVSVNFTAADGGEDFTASYTGAYAAPAEATNKFIFDTEENEAKAAFYNIDEDNALLNLYYSIAAITDAKKLEDTRQYVHLAVPFSALWNGEFDITSGSEFSLEFVDEYGDQTYSISNGNLGGATGTISVEMSTEGNYTTVIDLSGLGGEHTLQVNYSGDHLLYSLTTPNAYQLQGGESVALKSAVLTYADDTYTVYLSSEEGVTTVEGMANADVKLEFPATFMDGDLYGFSGDENRAKINVTYDGVTYNQANTTKGGDDALAIGGNIACSSTTSTITVDFSVFNIYKYNNANLTGHYEGPMTWAQ